MPKKHSSLRLLFIATGGSFVLVAAIVALLIGLDKEEREQRAWVKHTYEVIEALRDVLSTASEAEIATRAFLPADNESRLVPYREATTHISSSLANLERLVSDNPEQEAAAASVAGLVDEEFTALESIVSAAESGDQPKALRAFNAGRDVTVLETAQQSLLRMEAEQRAQLGQREARIDRIGILTQYAVALLLLLVVSWVAGTAWIFALKERQRTLAEEQLLQSVIDRKKAEEEAVRHKRIADEANKAKSEFLAMMSHELRTPMTGILGLADLILLGGIAQEQQTHMRQLKRAAHALLDILNDILDFSKIEAGKLEIEAIPFSLGDILADIAGLFGPVASQKGLVLETTATPDLYDALVGDPKRIRQIMVNLVANAVKFTSEGRVDLRVNQSALDAEDILLRVAVSDTGLGISKEAADRLFQPFVQADASTSRKFGGTGLGLTISRHLTSAMKGKIWVESVPGQGSTFAFEIPLKRAPNAVAQALQDDRRTVAPRVLRPLRILLAEDTDTVRMVITAMLRKMGHTVDAAEEGVTAVAKAKAGIYDAILMDMQMPVMDGLEATATIRKISPELRAVPIIALTADAIVEHRDMYLSAGVDAVVTKPVDWGLLTAMLARLVPVVAVPAIMDRRKEETPDGTPVLNEAMIRELAAALGGEALGEFFKTFKLTAEKYHSEVLAALSAHDLKKAKRIAHALKGLSSQLGADQLATQAEGVEVGAATIEDAVKQVPHLTEALSKTLLAIDMKYAE